ncbi:hypothetical protein PsYK624_164940 [Phanerochaete sordida]|uniref:BTB domain-containing protein n=1 Tax=Phanerochaete sordida TaxID=48140 RepID=A0A9P3LLX5_9APHY|nr:hypothetical protein PsYK624_164940 [Phanerochaete sordida]
MSTPLHALAKVPAGGSLADALAEALAGKPFNDVVFLAPVRAGEGVRRAVYANSAILCAASGFFHELLSEEGAGVSTIDVPPRASAKSRASCASESSNSLADEDIDASESLLATPSEVSFSGDEEAKVSEAEAGDLTGVPVSFRPPSGARIVTLDNIPADTLEAVIFCIYTGTIHFLPLRSQGTEASDDARAAHALAHPNRPIASCKAVYRFATEAGLADLKHLSSAHLFASLSPANILTEVFSSFSSEHPAILRRQAALLLERYWTLETRAALGPIVDRTVRGELPHAGPALGILLGEITPAPRKTGPAVNSPASERAPAEPAHTGRSASGPLPVAPPAGGPARTQAGAAASSLDDAHPVPATQTTGPLSSARTSVPTSTPFTSAMPPAPTTADASQASEDGAPGAHKEQSTAARLGALLAQKAAARAREAQTAGTQMATTPQAAAPAQTALVAQAAPPQHAAAQLYGQPEAPATAPAPRSSTWWRDALRSAVVVDLDEASMHAPTDGSEWSGAGGVTDECWDACWDAWGDGPGAARGPEPQDGAQTAAPSQSSSASWRGAGDVEDEAGMHAPAGEHEGGPGATRQGEVQTTGAQTSAGQTTTAPPSSTSWRAAPHSAVHGADEVRTHASDGGSGDAAAAAPQLERRDTVPDAPSASAGGEDARCTTQGRRADLGLGLSRSQRKALRKKARTVGAGLPRVPQRIGEPAGVGSAAGVLQGGEGKDGVAEGGSGRRAGT